MFVAVLIGASGGLDLAQAQHVIVLKNGRQITVQSYREEGSMIKFNGLGGEIGLPKDQIQAILKPGQSHRPGVSISDLEASSRQPATAPQKTPAPAASTATSRPQSVGETTSVPLDEIKDYQKRFAEVTQKLETASREYFEATQGGGTGSNVSKEGMRSWAMDLASRIHDSQKVPGGGGDSSTPPTPPYAPAYTAKEKELSDLRTQIDRLQKERDGLIQEMKSRNIPTS
ncbi:MAG: hypothetical protein ACREP3_16200 [Candidatus Binatia bacterium]